MEWWASGRRAAAAAGWTFKPGGQLAVLALDFVNECIDRGGAFLRLDLFGREATRPKHIAIRAMLWDGGDGKTSLPGRSSRRSVSPGTHRQHTRAYKSHRLMQLNEVRGGARTFEAGSAIILSTHAASASAGWLKHYRGRRAPGEHRCQPSLKTPLPMHLFRSFLREVCW